jgi:hypothetical protein
VGPRRNEGSQRRRCKATGGRNKAGHEGRHQRWRRGFDRWQKGAQAGRSLSEHPIDAPCGAGGPTLPTTVATVQPRHLPMPDPKGSERRRPSGRRGSLRPTPVPQCADDLLLRAPRWPAALVCSCCPGGAPNVSS